METSIAEITTHTNCRKCSTFQAQQCPSIKEKPTVPARLERNGFVALWVGLGRLDTSGFLTGKVNLFCIFAHDVPVFCR